MIWYYLRWQILVPIVSLPHIFGLCYDMMTCADLYSLLSFITICMQYTHIMIARSFLNAPVVWLNTFSKHFMQIQLFQITFQLTFRIY